MAEQLTLNQRVVGSTPTRPTNKIKELANRIDAGLSIATTLIRACGKFSKKFKTSNILF
ncbi:hypothetical protein GAMM_210004 [Gammaproteobacteria bacterium]